MAIPSLSPEWKDQMQALSYSELKSEIEREETELGELYQSLYDADERLGDAEDQIDVESRRDEAQRWLGRQRTIQRLRTRIAERQRRIDDLTQKALGFERMPTLISVVERYIRLEVAASLWRTVSALMGWQTRQQRSLTAYQGWQTREAPLTERLRQLLADRAKWKREADTLATRIKVTEAQIAYKKEILPKVKLSRVSIALYLIIEGGEHTYPRDEGRRYIYRKPHYRSTRNRVRYPKGRFQSILQCLPKGIPVLTTNGIKSIEKIRIGDLVWGIDLDTMKTEAKPVIALIKRYYKGDLIHFKNRDCDIKVTPDHHMIYKVAHRNIIRLPKHNYPTHIEKAKNIVDKIKPAWTFFLPYSLFKEPKKIDNFDISRFYDRREPQATRIMEYLMKNKDATAKEISKNCGIPLSTIYYNLERNLRLPDYSTLKYNINDFLELLGWYISEGNPLSKYNDKYGCICIGQDLSSHPAYYKEICDLLDRMGLHATKRPDRILFSQIELVAALIHYGGKGAKNKFIHHDLFELPKNSLKHLFDSLIKGDGTDNREKGYAYYIYYTSSNRLKDDMIWLSNYLGYRASAKYYEKWSKWHIYLNPQKNHLTNIRASKEPYEGYVYDITVEDNHNFFAGCDGKFVLVGNCDSFIDPQTGELRTDIDPFRTLENTMRSEVSNEFIEEFSLKEMNPEDLTLGVVNIVAGEEEIGKPPFKLYISRTDEETGKDWRTTVNRYIMTDSQYLNLVRNMKEYLETLEAMG